jgi:dihydrofolate reductase
VIKDDIAGEIAKLRDKHDRDILVNGSAQLVQLLVENNLVDEYRIMVFPVVLGSGKRLFLDTSGPSGMTLVDSKAVGDGVLIATYRPL